MPTFPNSVRVAMLADNTFTADKRIYREAKTLIDAGYDLTLYAVKGNGLHENDVVDGIPVKRIFSDSDFDIKTSRRPRALASFLASTKPHVVHCHDWEMLHIGRMVKELLPDVKLIYDSHELFHSWPIHYSSRRFGIVVKSWLVRKVKVAREKKDAQFADRVITVSQSMANHLENYFGLQHKITLVRNFAEFEPITERRDFVRDDLGIPKTDKVVVLFAHYIYRKQRNIETVIDQLSNKPGIALVIFCADGGHKRYFVQMAAARGLKNVYFHDAISPSVIVNYLASCDIGLIPTWNKKHLSYWLGLENKLFHYVMSELPVLASAQPEHKRVVEAYRLGVCVNGDEPNVYVEGLNQVLTRYDEFKRNAAAAKHELCWEKEKTALLNLYKDIFTPT